MATEVMAADQTVAEGGVAAQKEAAGRVAVRRGTEKVATEAGSKEVVPPVGDAAEVGEREALAGAQLEVEVAVEVALVGVAVVGR